MSGKKCEKCSLAIDCKVDSFTVCEWRCAKSFHAACAGLTEEAANTATCNYLLWICEECRRDFGRTRDKISGDDECSEKIVDPIVTTTEREISTLKAKVAEISETLASIAPRRISFKAYDQAHSTPVSSLGLLEGTRLRYEDSTTNVTTAGEHSTHANNRNTFALFLSNIDFYTSEDDVHVLVCESLGIAETNLVHVKKLVSRWRTGDDTDFISFKVVLDAEFKLKAMDPATWPCGVRYREFVQRYNAWKPKIC